MEDISFQELMDWVGELPDQVDGLRSTFADTGEPYQEFYLGSVARPADKDIVTRRVCGEFKRQLENYLSNRSGRIYWHCRIEMDSQPSPIFVEYREDGPDLDFALDRRGVSDKDWMTVKIYARLLRSDRPAKVAA